MIEQRFPYTVYFSLDQRDALRARAKDSKNTYADILLEIHSGNLKAFSDDNSARKPYSHAIKFHISPADLVILEGESSQKSMPVSAYVRELLFGIQSTDRRSKEIKLDERVCQVHIRFTADEIALLHRASQCAGDTSFTSNGNLVRKAVIDWAKQELA